MGTSGPGRMADATTDRPLVRGRSGKDTRTTTEVVLCTFNGAAFIIEQLTSILGQTVGVDRISIYDDRSTDGTVDAILQWRSGLPDPLARRICVDTNVRNLGYSQNFGQGIARSSADILFLSDQDDLWEEDKVETLASLMCVTGSDMAFSDGHLIDERRRMLPPGSVLRMYGLRSFQVDNFAKHAFKMLLKRNYINGAALAIRRAAAIDALPLSREIPHDYWLAIWCSLHGGIAATSRRLYSYRQHGRNAIGAGTNSRLANLISVWRHPKHPRDRESRIWNEIVERAAKLDRPGELAIARQKVAWLNEVLDESNGSLARLRLICSSLLNGNYRNFSPDYAYLRDVVRVIHGR